MLAYADPSESLPQRAAPQHRLLLAPWTLCEHSDADTIDELNER
jgi:hypothetical protein